MYRNLLSNKDIKWVAAVVIVIFFELGMKILCVCIYKIIYSLHLYGYIYPQTSMEQLYKYIFTYVTEQLYTILFIIKLLFKSHY